MGLWSRRSSVTLTQAELGLLSIACIRDQLQVKDVVLSSGSHLHCVICGAPDRPNLVLLHGLCGGGAVFYAILSGLLLRFRVYLVDLMGMGRSSRPGCTVSSLQEAESFFTQPLEEFCGLLGLERVVLMGHSFGGYIAGAFLLAYPSRVSQILLISPIGVTIKPSEYQFEESGTWREKLYWRVLGYAWRHRMTPNALLQMTGPLSGWILGWYTRRRMGVLGDLERIALSQYLEQICLLPSSGDQALIHLFQPGTYAYHPLALRFHTVDVPMAFIYGEHDWVSPLGGIQVRNTARAPVALYIVPDAGHMLYMDNPMGLLEGITTVLEDFRCCESLRTSEIWTGK